MAFWADLTVVLKAICDLASVAIVDGALSEQAVKVLRDKDNMTVRTFLKQMACVRIFTTQHYLAPTLCVCSEHTDTEFVEKGRKGKHSSAGKLQ